MAGPQLTGAELKREASARNGEIRLKSARTADRIPVPNVPLPNNDVFNENGDIDIVFQAGNRIDVEPSQETMRSEPAFQQLLTTKRQRRPFNDVPLHDHTDVTVTDACFGFLQYSRKFKLTDEAVKNLLKLMLAVMPEGHKLPRTVEAIEKLANSCIKEGLSPRTHVYCEICPPNQCQCSNPLAYFVENDCHAQLKRLVRDHFEEIRTYPKSIESIEDGYFDVHNGSAYKERLKDVPVGCTPLAFNLFVDGGSFTKSTTQQTWPICLMVLNLHPVARTKAKNIILAGFWHGPKPNWDFIITHLDGYFNRVIEIDGMKYFTFCAILTADMPARANFANIMGHGAVRACPFCHVEGCKRHKEGMQYPKATAPRTKAEFKESARLADIKNHNRKKLEEVDSVKGTSKTQDVIHCPDELSIDLMHTDYGGPGKDDLEKLTTGVSDDMCQFSKLDSTVLAVINDSFVNTSWPYEVSRKLRSLDDLKRYKASELSLCVTVMYATVIAAAIMETHESQARSMILFGMFTRYMAAEFVSSKSLGFAQDIIDAWFKMRNSSWGKNARTLKSHEVTHLPERVKVNGPPRRYSAFAGENMVGVVGKTITQRSKKVIVSQIRDRFDLLYKLQRFQSMYLLHPKIAEIVAEPSHKVRAEGVQGILRTSDEYYSIIKATLSIEGNVETQSRIFQKGLRYDIATDGNMANSTIYFKKANGTIAIGIIQRIFIVKNVYYFAVKEIELIPYLRTLENFIDKELLKDEACPLKELYVVLNPYKTLQNVVIEAENCMYKAVFVPYNSEVFYVVPFNLSYEHN